MAIANPTKDPSEQVQFRQLLEEAVTKPEHSCGLIPCFGITAWEIRFSP